MSPHLLLDTGALKTTGGKAEVPSLDKEGWLRPLRKCREASLAGADGVVGSSHLMARRPLLCQGGDFAFPAGCPRTPVSSGRLVGNAQASLQGGVAERFRKYREASAYREAGVVFR